MRRVLLSVLAAAMALTGVVLTSTAVPAGAAGIVDLSATTTGWPRDAVSPPGALAYYTATFTNEGLVPTPGTFTNVTTGGTVVGVTADGSCSWTANTVRCADTLAAGASKVVEVVVQSPTSLPASITNRSTATVSPGVVSLIDLVPVNDSSSVTTAVLPGGTVGSAGFVPEGGSLRWRKHTLTVLDAETGVITYLSDTPAPTLRSCGGSPCQQGLRVDFSEGGENEPFYGLVEVDVNFGTVEPCRGIGNPGCYPLYFHKPGMAAPQTVPACAAGVPMPCVHDVQKSGTEFHIDVRLDSSDPDLLSPVKNLSS